MAEQQIQTGTNPPKKRKIAENIVYIGGKPFLNYVTAVTTQFKTKRQTEIKIIARGKWISRAVDIAEVTVKKFMKGDGIKIDSIKTDSKEFDREFDGKTKTLSVSEIEITLKK